MKGLFIPGITAKMFRDASVESVAELMADGKIYDIDYQDFRNPDTKNNKLEKAKEILSNSKSIFGGKNETTK